MKRFSKIILNTLIDKYEDSLLYRNENQINITISFKFNKKTIPKYFDELDYQYKEDINEICKNLALNHFIQLVWGKYQEGNIIKQVNLNVEKVNDIYQYLNREEKKSKEENVLAILYKYKDNENLLGTFVSDMIEKLRLGESVTKYLNINDLNQINDILFSIDQILKQKVEIAKRIFSIKLFNNSKYFESIENKVIKILNDYGNYSDNILAEQNIVNNPGYVFLKGTGSFKLNEEIIDLNKINGEIALSSKIVESIEVISLNVNKVITIENLTSFHTYNNNDELIIYLGGFLNHLRAEFLEKIYQFNPNNLFNHWSDIDLGGFRIYNHLINKTNIPFLPYKMDKETLIKYQDYCMEIKSISYLNSLHELLQDENYQSFLDVIKYMITNKIRLEQEIIL